ncbi:MAG: hypothetical protein ACM3UR_01005 [Bacteroidota bacterium]|jgi:hypothetical protein|nr:hypothetical protein [Ignavibacteria bacterium]MCU7511391.1 hypothetical protein [Ignavibacteria bacterium]HEX2961398.1 hypothetical protein [Ignavibacteriales bacterium]
MKKLLLFLFLFLLSFCSSSRAQDESRSGDSIEVFLIDSYITPETPHKFRLTFYTSDSCKSRVVMQGKYEFIISKDYAEEHKADIDLTNLTFDSTDIPFVVYVEGKNGKTNQSEDFEVAYPVDNQSQEVSQGGSSIVMMCCFGGVIFGLPAPGYVTWGGKSYFSLTKEIPILSLVTNNYKYPVGYFSVEYSYIFQLIQEDRNFLRVGYKHIFPVPYIEYISPGLNAFSNLGGFNGLSPEVSVGLFKIYDIFTFYAKYRYNFKPGQAGTDFHEIMLGLYSGFFTFHLNI